MDNSNLIMRVKIAIHNQGSVQVSSEGYSEPLLEATVAELRADGYIARIEKNNGKTLLVAESKPNE